MRSGFDLVLFLFLFFFLGEIIILASAKMS